MAPPRLVYIQYLRAIAALAVVLYHLGYYMDQVAGYTGLLDIFSGYCGYFGVTTFFVISGYLMSSLIQNTSVERFAAHRVLRIYPIYWLTVAVLYFLRASAGMQRPLALVDLSLLPFGRSDTYLGVEWTLTYEIFYYAVSALFCIAALRRYHRLFLVGWLAVCVVVFVRAFSFATVQPAAFRHLATSMWNIPFLLGGLGYYVLLKVQPRAWWFLIGCSLALVSDLHSLSSRGLLGPLSCALIVLYVIHRNDVAPPRRPHPLWAALGDYSYGLYLVHVSVILLALSYLARVHPREEALDTTVVFGVVLAAGCAAGALDVWLYQRLKGFADRHLQRSPSRDLLSQAPALPTGPVPR